MATDGDFNQAFQSFSRRENLPAALTSEEWSTVPSEIRERAFFMSRVTDAEILQRFRAGVEEVLRGDKGIVTVEKEISFWLRDRGYKPPEGKAGSLQDLSSLKRIMVVLRTNIEMARGHANWVRMQTSIRAFPCRRFIRISARMEPRDWESRWNDAKAETSAIPGVHPTEKVALVNHPIWNALSRFDQPYSPYDFGSGMGDKLVSRTEALKLGFALKPNTDPMQQPIHRTMNDGLEVTPAITDPVLKNALTDKLGRFGEWDGAKVVFTDPDGSKKYPAAKLVELWAKPAPPGYDTLTQKDTLDKWSGGTIPDPTEARVILRKLFDRIETADIERPSDLWRVVKLSAADVVEMVRGLAKKIFRIPPNTAGWDWTASPEEALRMAGDIGQGWKVAIRVQGVSKAVDIRALRPGKPGFVYVGGTEFKVSGFAQDVSNRTVSINLVEK
jgi:hypothetical protein